MARIVPPPPPPPPSFAPAAVPVAAPAAASSDAKTLGVLSHVLGLLTGFLGPLVVLLACQDPLAKAHARRALNWQISLMIYLLISIPLFFVVVGGLLFGAVLICDLVFCIMATVKAGDNVLWTYPMTIPFVKD